MSRGPPKGVEDRPELPVDAVCGMLRHAIIETRSDFGARGVRWCSRTDKAARYREAWIIACSGPAFSRSEVNPS
jgi:hypothetical protein